MGDVVMPDAVELAGASILAFMRSSGACGEGVCSPSSERPWWSAAPLEAAPLPLFRPRAAFGSVCKALSASSPAASSGSSSGTMAYPSWEETSCATDASGAACVATSRGRRHPAAAAVGAAHALAPAQAVTSTFGASSAALGSVSPASSARSASPAPETPRQSPSAAPAAPSSPSAAGRLSAAAGRLRERAQASSAASPSAPAATSPSAPAATSPSALSRLRGGARVAAGAAGARGGVHKASGAASAIHARRSYTWRGVRRPRTPEGRPRRGAASGAADEADAALGSEASSAEALVRGASPVAASALPSASPDASAFPVDPREGDKEWAALTTWLRMNLHNPRTPRKLVLFVGLQDAATKRWSFALNPELEWADVSPDTRARLSNLLEEARAAFRRKYPGRHPEAWVRKSQKYRPPGSAASYQVTLGDLVTSLARVYEQHELGAARNRGEQKN